MVKFGNLPKAKLKMSKIGRQPITIPKGVNLTIEPGQITVTGPRGVLKLPLPEFIAPQLQAGKLIVLRRRNDKKTKSNHGTTRSLINNMIIGVVKGWEKELQVVGAGYKVNLEGDKLVFKLGFSHPVIVSSPEGIKFEVAENKVKIVGLDKELVGNTAAKIRKIRPPDVYKGKGIRYVNEVVKLKPGKAAKAGAAGGQEYA